jgi:predicted nucleic acid-binding protein
MIILDTNVFSEPTKPTADARVEAWFDRQRRESLHITAINLAELLEGIAILPEGRRKQVLSVGLEKQLAFLITTPILAFDQKAAHAYAELIVRAKANRYTLPIADAQIAAIAKVHGYAVATRDVEPFLAAGVPVINPWEE